MTTIGEIKGFWVNFRVVFLISSMEETSSFFVEAVKLGNGDSRGDKNDGKGENNVEIPSTVVKKVNCPSFRSGTSFVDGL